MSYINIGSKKGAQCDICERKQVGTPREFGSSNWDWITGYFSAAKHACPDCERSVAWVTLKAQALVKPVLSNNASTPTVESVGTSPAIVNQSAQRDAWKAEALAAREYIEHLENFILGGVTEFASNIMPHENKAYLAARVQKEPTP